MNSIYWERCCVSAAAMYISTLWDAAMSVVSLQSEGGVMRKVSPVILWRMRR